MKESIQPKFIFVIAEGKSPLIAGNNEQPTPWQHFLENTKRLQEQPSDIQKIHENVWLLSASTGVPFLAKLIELAQSYSVTVRVLYLAEAPDWITYQSGGK